MSFYSEMLVKWTGRERVSDAFDVLLANGWEFRGDVLHYEFGPGDPDTWKELEVPATEWPAVREQLDQIAARGQKSMVELHWSSRPGDTHFFFDSPNDLKVFPTLTREELPNCRQGFTDWSWYLRRIVTPLSNAGFNIIKVECSDYY